VTRDRSLDEFIDAGVADDASDSDNDANTEIGSDSNSEPNDTGDETAPTDDTRTEDHTTTDSTATAVATSADTTTSESGSKWDFMPSVWGRCHTTLAGTTARQKRHHIYLWRLQELVSNCEFISHNLYNQSGEYFLARDQQTKRFQTIGLLNVGRYNSISLFEYYGVQMHGRDPSHQW
jgi:hypothetical protein